MCIAIYKPENKTIPQSVLQTCFNANPDGAGFLYSKDKELHLEKGFFTFNDFYEAYKQHENEQAVIHFRIKTHGNINTENCHPFLVNKSLGFIHNGIISGFGSKDNSDTYHFNDELLKPLIGKYGNKIINDPIVKDLVEDRIGYSKLVFLDRHGNHNIFNEHKGVWDDGIWYSNTSYKPVIYAPKPTYTPPSRIASPYSPKSTINTSKDKVLEDGDLVELLTGIWDQRTSTYHKTGTLFEVVAINSDFTADLMTEHPKNANVTLFLFNISFAKFDFASVSTVDSLYAQNLFEGDSYGDI